MFSPFRQSKRVPVTEEITATVLTNEESEPPAPISTEELSAAIVRQPRSGISPASIRAPAFIKRLKGAFAREGSNIELEVQVAGDPEPTVVWYRNGKEIHLDGVHSKTAASGGIHKLIMNDVNNSDVRVIKCKAINDAGSAECETKLNIDNGFDETGPRFTKTLKNLELNEGEDAEFLVEYRGVPEPLVEWYKDSIHLTDDYGVEINTSPGRSRLFVPDISKDDIGVYRCLVMNSAGKVQCSVELGVAVPTPGTTSQRETPSDDMLLSGIGPPVIIEKPSDTRVYEGDSLNLVFKITGEPRPRVRWLKDGKDIEKDVRFEVEQSEDVWKVVIKRAELHHQGNLVCQAENEHGHDECSVQIRIEESIVAPSFVRKANDIVAKLGSKCQFIVKVKGKPMPNVEWYKDGRLLRQTEGLKYLKDGDKQGLIINHATKDKTGTYKCVAVNSAGEASCSCSLFIKGEGRPPSFVKNLVDQEIVEGSPAHLDVIVTAEPKADVKWYKDNIALRQTDRFRFKSDSEVHSLFISSPVEDDWGVFKCIATNPHGSATSEANITVVKALIPPYYIHELKDYEVQENDSLEITVQVGGAPRPDVKWYKNGKVIKNSSRVRIIYEEDKHKLILDDLKQDDSGEYSCVASSVAGESTSLGFIKIQTPSAPVFSVKPSDITAIEGDQVSLSACATGFPEPYFQWLKEGTLLRDGNEYGIKIANGCSTLTLRDCKMADSGDYECVAKNTGGTTRCSISVTIKEMKQYFPPEFTSALGDLEVTEDDPANFEVGVIGLPEPKVTWLKDGVEIKKSTKAKFSVRNGLYALSISRCSNKDAGCYECIASNSIGRVSCQAILGVVSQSEASEEMATKKHLTGTRLQNALPPKFHKIISDQEVNEGETLLLEAVVSGRPFPTVQWYRENKLLRETSRVKMILDNETGGCSLEIKRSNSDDFGEYECVAKNSSGEASTYCEVTVNPIPHEKRKWKRAERVREGKERRADYGSTGKDFSTEQGTDMMDSDVEMTSQSDRLDRRTASPALKERDDVKMSSSSSEGEKEEEKPRKRPTSGGSFRKETRTIKVAVRSTSAPSSGDEPDLESDSKSQSQTSRKRHKDSDFFASSEDDEKRKVTKPAVKKGVLPQTQEEEVVPIEEGIVQATPMETEAQNQGLSKPVFLSRPNDFTLIEGQTAVLEVEVKGTPSPEIQWLRDGKLVMNSPKRSLKVSKTLHTLTITDAEVTDEAEYTCVAQNAAGKATCSCFVNISQARQRPVFKKKLEDLTCSEGDDLISEVKVEGYPQPEVEFFHGHKAINEDGRHNIQYDERTGTCCFVMKNAEVTDTGSYKCVARNEMGQATSTARFTITEPALAPQFLKRLLDITGTEGKELALKVEVTGKPKPVVTWYHQNEVIKPFGRFRTRTDGSFSTLTLNKAKIDDSGIIRCTASNSAGEVETGCNIMIEEELKMPEFVHSPRNLRLVEGQSGSFRVTFEGKPTPEIDWYLDEFLIENGKYYDIRIEDLKSILTIKDANADLSGIYKCVATNKVGSESCSAKLTIEEAVFKPYFTDNLQEQHVVEGEIAAFMIEVKANPPAAVEWCRNGKRIANNKDYEIMSTGSTHILNIASCQARHGGLYSITAKNSIGEAVSRAKLYVEELSEKPVFTTPLTDTQLFESDTVEFIVAVDGKPVPSVKWFHNENELKANSRCKMRTDGNKHALAISDVCPKDEGKYECMAENKAGTVTCSCSLTVKEPLFPPEFVVKPHDVTVEEGESVKLDFVVIGNPRAKVTLMKDGKKVREDMQINIDMETGECQIAFPELTKEHAGTYVVEAKNSMGTSNHSFQLTVRSVAKSPVFTKVLSDLKVPRGKSAMLGVEFTGNVLDVDWYKDDNYITDSDKYEIRDEEYKCTLVVHECEPEDEGIYKCEIGNDDYHITTAGSLTVSAPETKPTPKQSVEEEIQPVRDTVVKAAIPTLPASDSASFSGSEPSSPSSQRSKSASVRETAIKAAIPILPASDSASFSGSEPSSPSLQRLKGASTKPNFITKLDNYEGKPGEQVQFRVKVTGKPNPTLTWLKDGKPVEKSIRIMMRKEGAGARTLIIRGLKSEDQGEYTCIASNSDGEARCSASLVMKKPSSSPKFTKKPGNVNINEGETATFEFSVIAQPKPTVKCSWKSTDSSVTKDVTHLLSGDTDYQLTLDKCELTQSGIYRFEAQNTAGKSSCIAELEVVSRYTKPTFTERLTDIDTKAGQNVTLQVKVEGKPKPEVQWQKDGKNITQDGKYQHEKKGLLHLLKINDVNDKDSGSYSCTAGNEAGKEQCSCKLSVSRLSTSPTFSRKLEDIKAHEGSDISLAVEAQGHPEPSVKWLKDGKPLTESKRIKIEQKGLTFVLSIKNATDSDQGNYSCTARNSVGQTVTDCSVTVSKASSSPVFLTPLKDVSCTQSEQITLTVKADGTPSPKVKWFHNDHPISKGRIYDINNDLVNRMSHLIIKSCDSSHVGKYKAVASNSKGDVSCVATVSLEQVKQKPSFEKSFSDQTVESGQKLIFRTVVKSIPEPEVCWFKDSAPITEGNRFQVERKDSHCKLIIDSVESGDSGLYLCTAKNIAGDVSCSATLTVKDPGESSLFFSEPLQDLHIFEGKEVLLKAKVSGIPPFTCKWDRNGKPVRNTLSTRIEKKDNLFTLRVTKPNIIDSGVYTCAVTNDTTGISCSCQVTVAKAPVPPSFILKLRDVTVFEGKDAEFSVKLAGQPEPTVRWFLNKNEVEEGPKFSILSRTDGKRMLKILSPTADDAGFVKCEASNAGGDAVSTGKLSVRGSTIPPEIKAPLKDQTLQAGDSLKWEVEVIGKPPPAISWFKNGKEITESSRVKLSSSGNIKTLTIDKVNSEDEGKYKVVARTTQSLEKSSTAILIIQDSRLPPNRAPEFLSPLENISAEAGESVSFTVEVLGQPNPTVQWYYNGRVLRSGRGYQMKQDGTTHTLNIAKVKSEHVGTYGCSASNDLGKVSCDATLAIKTNKIAPEFLKLLENIDAKEGQSITLTSHVDGKPKPVVKFYKNDTLLENSKDISISEKCGTWQITFRNMKTTDSGTYKCTATNEAGSASCTSELSVSEEIIAPTFSMPKDYVPTDMEEGKDIRLELIALGKPLPTVEWFKDDVSVKDNSKLKLADDGSFHALTVVSASPKDSGKYKCMASNLGGKIARTFTVNIEG